MVSKRAALIAVFVACTALSYAADAVFYDGVFDLGKGPTGRWEEAKLRDWLWRHWHQHTAGTAILKWVTTEGDSGASEYRVAMVRGISRFICRAPKDRCSRATRQSGAMSGRLLIRYNALKSHITGIGRASRFQIHIDCRHANSSWS